MPQTPSVDSALPFLALLLASASWAAEPLSVEAVQGPYTWGSVDHVTRLGTLWLAGQPDRAALERAKAEGVVAVINLRDPSEHDWDEAAVVRELGLTYHSIPLSGKRFSLDAMREIETTVSGYGDQPILVHCSSANRAAGWLATRLVLQEEVELELALAVARRAGVTKPVVEYSVRQHLREKEAQRRAVAALTPFKKNLMGALKGALGESGPRGAVEACRAVAPRLAEEASGEVAVGRTSHKLRNSANAPAPWMEPILEEFRDQTAQPAAERIVELEPNRFGYASPIYVNPLCLTCHGTAVEAPTLEHIQSLYPEDQATGFADGDFRGLFWAEVSLEE